MMKRMKRGLAVLLAALLVVPTLPVSAEETAPAAEVVGFNTGNHTYSVVMQDAVRETEKQPVSGGDSGQLISGGDSGQPVLGDDETGGLEMAPSVTGDAYFEEDGSYTINIPEENPFFPYEVQFTCGGEVTREWFMTPDDSVEIGGHTFYVNAAFDNRAVTQLTLDVAGNKVVVYPKEKEFTEDGGIAPISLLPLTGKWLDVNLTGYTPAELTMVKAETIFGDQEGIPEQYDVVWSYSGDDYEISLHGETLDLSRGTYYGGTSWNMIVGEADQLASDNIRYTVYVNNTSSQKWLVPTAYVQSSTGARTEITRGDYDYYDSSVDGQRYLSMYLSYEELNAAQQVYVGLKMDEEVFPTHNYDHYKVFAGQYGTVAEAEKGTDITAKLFAEDMTQADAGYLVNVNGSSEDNWVTMVTYDGEGNATGCLPFRLRLYTSSTYVSLGSMYIRNSSGSREYISNFSSRSTVSGVTTWTITLLPGYAADGKYFMSMDYYKVGRADNDAVTAAYVGNYNTIAAAEAAKAENVTEALFGTDYDTNGYEADYSQGVEFTVFVGEDGNAKQEVYHIIVKTEAPSESSTTPSSPVVTGGAFGTSLTFEGLVDADGKTVPAYVIGYYVNNNYNGSYETDSYGEENFKTILVGKDVDLTKLAPRFSHADKSRVYAGGNEEISGESYHDFSKGPVQYTVAAENGEIAANYWLQVVQVTGGAGQLYINSLADPAAGTRTENGVIYSTREVLLDSPHGNVHDILVANMGTAAMENLTVTLESEVLELDEYWTLKGAHELGGYQEPNADNQYSQSNLAKIRLTAKEGMDPGSDVSGTLTIRSGGKEMIVLALTGTVGDPSIITKEIPQAVKYVPYGAMVQNSNKYSWNKVSYRLWSGTLPKGMEVKTNGEIYGVPQETGDFTFSVRMENSYSGFSDCSATYTLKILENTDQNVDAATDEGYTLTQRIEEVGLDQTEEQLMVSQGTFDEFQEAYLDGVKLIRGTDYTAESGSTRITILSQTLKNAGLGNHTIGVEFRENGTDLLKRAAQNFMVRETVSQGGNDEEHNHTNGADNGSGGSGSSNGADNGSGGSGSSNGANNGSGSSGSSNGANNGSGSSGSSNGANNSSDSFGSSNGGSGAEANAMTSEEWKQVTEKLIAAGGGNFNISTGEKVDIPQSILQAVKTSGTTLALHTSAGMALSISKENLTDSMLKSGINANVKVGMSNIPGNLKAQKAAGAVLTKEVSITGSDFFGGIVNMHWALGADNYGKYANLYFYNRETGKLELLGYYVINQDGQAMFGIDGGGEFLVTVTSSRPTEKVTVRFVNRQYLVKPGDTLYGIANKYNMSLKELISKNAQIRNPSKIKVGEKIIIR